MRPKTSGVWNYFLVETDDTAKCKLCNRIYSRKGKCTTSLKNHLKCIHRDEFKQMSAQTETQKSANLQPQNNKIIAPLQTSEKQVTLEESLTKNQHWEASHTKSKEIDKLVAELLALHNLPFDFVEWPGFRRLLHAAIPKYNLRGRQFFTQYLHDVLYPEVVNKVQLLLEEFSKCSFIIDIWSEPSTKVSLLGITAHGLDSEFNRINIILKCEAFQNLRHTGENIANKFENVLAQWNCQEKVFCVVRDSEANMVHGMNLAGVKHVSCSIHKLQLCVRTALDQEYIKELLTKCRNIAANFNYSLKALFELKIIQIETLKNNELSVVQECSTKWNTTYYMLKRLLQIKDAINLYTSNRNTISMISAQDWFDLEKIVAILKPFEEVTKEMSSSQACISSVIPLIYTLKSTLNNTISTNNDESEYIKMFIRKLFDDINLRFADTENDMFYVLATYLDPRYKAKFFSDVTKEKIQEHLLLAVSQCADSDNVEVVPSKKIRLSNENVGEYSKKINNIQEHLYDLLESDDDDGEIGQKCADFDEYIKSLSDYSNEKRIKIQENPLNWWKTNAHKYKCMLSIVRQYLSCPAGSVPNEQLFSGAGLIYDPLRNGLDSDKAAKFFLMKYNLPITNDY